MSRRRRHTESGEVALMAVVTKAMGAFLILMIFGFKYYVEDTVGKAEVQNARQQIEDAKSQLAAMSDKAKNADAANAQMAEMKKQLDAAMKPLNAAEDAMGELKARLDQASSQINKLKQEKAFVENELAQAHAQVDPLKNEVARLGKENDALSDQLKKAEADRKKLVDDMNARLAQSQQRLKDLAAQKTAEEQKGKAAEDKLDAANKDRAALNDNMTFSVTAKSCRGMALSIYVRSEWQDHAMPPPDRTVQAVEQYYATNDTLELIDKTTRVFQAVFTDVTPGQKFTLYGKYLNAVPGNNVDTRSCSLDFRVSRTTLPGSTVMPGTEITGAASLTEANPYVMILHTFIQPSGDVDFTNVTADEQSSFVNTIMQSACEGLSCGWSSKEAVPFRRKGFVDRMMPILLPLGTVKDDEETKIVSAFLDDLGLRLEQGDLTIEQALKWAEIPAIDARFSFNAQTVPAIFRDWETRLALAKAPDSVIKEFHRRAAAGWYSPAVIVDNARWFAGIGIPPIARNQATDEFRKFTAGYGARVWDVDAIGKDIALGTLTESEGIDLLQHTTKVTRIGVPMFLATERINEAASFLNLDDVLVKHLNDQLLSRNITEADIMETLAKPIERKRRAAIGGAR